MVANEKKLRMLMTTTSYPKDSSDWKGIFMRHLVFALSRDPKIELSLWAPPGEVPNRVSYACSESEAAWLDKLMESGGIAHRVRTKKIAALVDSIRLLWYLGRAYRRCARVDLIHANWLQSSIPLAFFPKPALVTILGSDLALLKLPGLTSVLRAVFRRCRCILAPNAQWMVPVLEKKFGDVCEIQYIPFGIDDAWFNLERALDTSRDRWLLVSRLTAAKIGPLFDWGPTLFKEGGRELHLFGPMQEDITLPPWIHYHGPTHPQALLQSWFPTATGLITLSRHNEGLPQIILEAMASGLPVLASDLPAHRSVIAHRESGWITSDCEDFARGLRWLADPSINQTIGQRARTLIRRTMGTWEDCAKRYATAYGSLLNR
jgi:hypothetical protein